MYPLSPNTIYGTVGQPDSRRVAIPTSEPDIDPSPNLTVSAIAIFQIKQRDTLDFTVDLQAWLGANGHAQLSNAVWAVAAGSPSSPVVAGSAYSAAGVATVVITPAVNAKPGDAYWMEVTLTIGATTATNVGDVAIPARTLVRRINIVVVAG